MFKHLIILFVVMVLGSIEILAQGVPTIYQTFVRESPGNDNSGQIMILDALTLTVKDRIITTPFQPENIIISPDEKIAFVINDPIINRKQGLLLIDLVNKKLIRTLFEGNGVYGLKMAPNGTIWVLLNNTQEIAIIDKTLNIKNIIKLTNSPRDLVFNTKNRQVYVSSVDSEVFVFDYISESLVTILQNLPKGDKTQIRHQELEISPDGKTLYVGSDDTISIINLVPPNMRVTGSFPLPRTNFGDFLLKITNDGKFLYAAEYLGDDIHIYNTETKLVTTIKKGRETGITSNLNLSSDGRLLYITGFYGVSILSVETNSLIKNITTSTGIGFPNPFSVGATIKGDFSVGQAPALQTTAPVTNQQVMAGQELTIKWQTTVAPQSFSIASHKVELSTDEGTSFTTIPKAENLGADVREFTWQVPSDIETVNKAQIRVSTVDLGAKRANSTTGNFSIIRPGGGQTGDTQAPMVVFLSPKGGERFTSGDNLQISWMSSDNVGVISQDLSLSTDGGNTFPVTLASGLPGTTQSFSFPIPMSLQSDQARLRLIVRDSAGNMSQSLTPSSFRIELGADTIAPTVTITQPTANQKLIAGQPIDVKWQSTDNRQLVSQALQLSLDGGNTFATVASFGASDNSFIINNIAELAMTNAQAVVRITATDSSGNIGQASVMFSMSSAITSANYQAKVLSLTGIGFISNASGSTTRVFVNEREITITPTMLSNNNLTIKGSKKKLGIVKGNNSVRLLIDGVSSNTLSFNF